MIELADTSAWTNRRKDPAVAEDFASRVRAGEIATCEMVELEMLFGTREIGEFREVRDDFEALRQVPISAWAWRRALDVFESLAEEGSLHHRRVALTDLLIAAAAETAGLRVCHYDSDFERIAEVTGQPVRAIAPLGSLS